MIDCYSPLTPHNVKSIKAAGHVGVCRYLGAKTHGWSKGLTPAEVADLKAAGLKIVSVWEGESTSVDYFTTAQGRHDALDAMAEAEWLGQPAGSAIYFAVDFDAQPADYHAIFQYFIAARKAIGSRYKLGVYGGFYTLQALYHSAAHPDRFWQTLAWSGEQIAMFACLYQGTVNQMIDGVGIDVDSVISDPGWWPAQEMSTILQFGNNGEEVKTLQMELNAVLGTHISEDGVYGTATETAVKSYQQIHHLLVTGSLDARTAALLQETLKINVQKAADEVQQAHADKVQDALARLAEAEAIIKTL